MLAVYGDFSAPDMKARIEKALGGWNYTQPAVPPFPQVQSQTAAGVYLAAQAGRQPDLLQRRAPRRHAPGQGLRGARSDGRHPGRRLPQPSVPAHPHTDGRGLQHFRELGRQLPPPGPVYGFPARTKSASTEETLKAVREEIERMRTTEVTDEEIKDRQGHRAERIRLQLRHPRRRRSTGFCATSTTAIRATSFSSTRKPSRGVTRADVAAGGQGTP